MIGLFDIHCHILPNIDDGAKNFEESLQMLEREYLDGVRGIVFTPHYRRRMFTADRDAVSRVFEQIREASGRRWDDLRLYLGCEYHVDLDMEEMLEQDPRYRMAGTRCVLAEFSEMDEYSYLRSRLHALQSCGFRPIIAHAERCHCLTSRPGRVGELVDSGVQIQINSGSILGRDGRGVRSFCRKLLDEELVHYIGSDAHGLHERKPDLGECAAYLQKRYGEAYARRILTENPDRLLA